MQGTKNAGILQLIEKPKRMAEKKEPVILVINDDGVTAPGIQNLVEAVKDLGKIVVVAPDKPQSGMGHAITIGVPLRLHKVTCLAILKPINVQAHLWIV